MSTFDILAFHATLKGLDSTLKGEKIREIGFVTSKGKTAWTSYYEAVLAARQLLPDYVDPEHRATIDLMLHYVNTYSSQFSAKELTFYWEDYANGADEDGTDEVDNFVGKYGLTNVYLYDDYMDVVNDFPKDVVDAFIENNGISNVRSFVDSYEGVYQSEEDFAQEYVERFGDEIPAYVVDWKATWHQSLRHNFTFNYETGAVFADNF